MMKQGGILQGKKLILLLAFASLAFAQKIQECPLVDSAGLNTSDSFSVKTTTFKGKKAIEVYNLNKVDYKNSIKVIPIDGTQEFVNGIIELQIAGDILENQKEGSRGFVGLAFRVQDVKTYDAFYIRPANGRANDQVRRNHSIQYISHPEFTWDKLRKESPKMYETYADMGLGEWVDIKIEIQGKQALLYVNNSKYPTMVVNDLKGDADIKGAIGLWLEPSTKAYFRNLKITYKELM